MQYLFIITYIAYLFYKIENSINENIKTENYFKYINHNLKKTIFTIDWIYVFFYITEIFVNREVFLIFSILNILLCMYYSQKTTTFKITNRSKRIHIVELIIYIVLINLFFYKPTIICPALILIALFSSYLINLIIIFTYPFEKLETNKKLKNIKEKLKTTTVIISKTSTITALLKTKYICTEIESNDIDEIINKINEIDKFTNYVILKTNINKFKVLNPIYINNQFEIKKIKYNKTNTEVTYKTNKSNTITTRLYSIKEIKELINNIIFCSELMTPKQIEYAITKVKPNKIIVTNKQDITIIDNQKCENLNEHYEGLDILKSFKGFKIVATSGNNKEEFYHALEHEFDILILKGKVHNDNIYEILLDNDFNKNNFYTVDNDEEIKKIISLFKTKKPYVLLDKGDICKMIQGK